MDDFKMRRPISVNAAEGNTISLCIANNLVYMGLSLAGRIDILSLEGELQSSTGCKGKGGPGQLSCPYICTTDDAGTAIIADSDNDRLQLLNANGQWNTVQLKPSVEGPMSACLMNDTLYVNECDNEMIHAYKIE